jgi:hypothetical protein
MKKIFSTILFSSLFTISILAQNGIATTVTISKANSTPVLDGTEEETWDAVDPNFITSAYLPETPSINEGGSSYWKALFTDEGIYVLVHVFDDVFQPDYLKLKDATSYQQDHIETYWDMNAPLTIGLFDGKGPSYKNSGHLQFAPDITEDMINGGVIKTDYTSEGAAAPAKWSMKKHGSAAEVIYEQYIPFTSLRNADGGLLYGTVLVGFDVIITDNDDGSENRNRAVWSSTDKESYINMDDAGTILLDDVICCIPPHDIEISSSSTEITNDCGSIQFTVYPSNASINWVILPGGSGKATISKTGLLKPLLDGSITVVAKTNDGSKITSNPIDITISNQCISKEDISDILDGSFDGPAPGIGEVWEKYDAKDSLKLVNGQIVCNLEQPFSDPWKVSLTQNNIALVSGATYELSFYASAENDTTAINLVFEDNKNGYVRFGTSTDTDAIDGNSEWHVHLTHDFIKYYRNITFDDDQETLDSRNRQFNIFFGLTAGIVVIDSVYLIREDFKDLLGFYCYNCLDAIKESTENKFELFPNPVVNELKIRTNNTTGNVTVNHTILKGTEGSFDVSNYPKGIYFVKVGSYPVEKFVK